MSEVDEDGRVDEPVSTEAILGQALIPADPSLRRAKTGGRKKGTPNRITKDLRATLRELADSNADRVAEWLDAVAAKDPAEAFRLYLGLLRYCVPTLSATAVADLTPKPAREQFLAMSDRELLEVIAGSPEQIEVYRQGMAVPLPDPTRYLSFAKTKDEEILR